MAILTAKPPSKPVQARYGISSPAIPRFPFPPTLKRDFAPEISDIPPSGSRAPYSQASISLLNNFIVSIPHLPDLFTLNRFNSWFKPDPAASKPEQAVSSLAGSLKMRSLQPVPAVRAEFCSFIRHAAVRAELRGRSHGKVLYLVQ